MCCSAALCDVICLSYDTLREALLGTPEAAYHLCNAVHSMLDLYAELNPSNDQDQISSLPLIAGVFICSFRYKHGILLSYLDGVESFL